jgi:shikimate kinase
VVGVEYTLPKLVALVGLSGVGKTTVARRLAVRWGWRALDLDHDIAFRANETISEIFEHHGEPEFRRLERAALIRALGETQVVLATGGGAPCQPGAMDTLLEEASVVWLDAPPAVLAARLSAAVDRPLLPAGRLLESLESQHRARVQTYQRAHLRVSVAKRDIAEVVATIVERLEVQHV